MTLLLSRRLSAFAAAAAAAAAASGVRPAVAEMAASGVTAGGAVGAAPNIVPRRAGDRGSADHGWLKTSHTFSFADYFDPQVRRQEVESGGW